MLVTCDERKDVYSGYSLAIVIWLFAIWLFVIALDNQYGIGCLSLKLLFLFFLTSAQIKRTCRKAPGLGFSGIEARIPAARRVIVCSVKAKQNHIVTGMMQVQFLSMTG